MKKIFILMIFAVLLLGSVSAFDWTNGTIAYYALNETAGTGVNDSTHNYNGTCLNCEGNEWNASGKVGYARQSNFYTDPSEGVAISDNAVLDSIQSISFWYVNLQTNDSGGEGRSLVGKEDNTNATILFIDNSASAGTLGFFLSTAGASTISIGNVQKLVWHHIVLTISGTNATVYLDGAQNSSANTASTTAFSNNKNLTIGGNPANERGMVGLIDEVGLWNRTLTVSEVGQLYNSGNGISYGGGVTTPLISVSLTTPTNNSQTSNSTQIFTALLTNETYALVNATLYIWYTNGTLYTSQTNTTLSSVNTANVTFSVTFTDPKNYLWNVKGRQGNANGINSSFAVNNFTFLTGISTGNEQYNTPVMEQSSQTFRINLSTSGFGISTATLVYNETNYSGSFSLINATTTQVTASLVTPIVTADTNLSFYWSITFTGSSAVVTTTSHNQTVLNFGVDNCATGTVMILNFTLVDETSQVKFANATNTSIKIDLDFYSNFASTTPIFEYSHNYNMTNPARVCLSSALANTSYYVDAQIEYTANGYANEFYNIQKYNLNATNNPSQNITLYDLISSLSQVFKITYRDSSYLPVSNALIQIGRLYTEEGTTKTVEIPKTDSYGATLGNLQLNNGVYTFTVTKNGEVLGVFPNSIAICQNPTITPCEISLSSFSSGVSVVNFTTSRDFLYTFTYNNATRTISTSFTIPSGAASTVLLNVSTATAIKTSVCSTSVVTSSGTLTCAIPMSFGNTTVRAELYKDGSLVAWWNTNLQQTPKQLYGPNIVFLSIFIFLTLIGAGIADNPIFMVISFIMGVFLLMMLGFVSNSGFIGGGASVLYLVIALIIILIKGVNRN